MLVVFTSLFAAIGKTPFLRLSDAIFLLFETIKIQSVCVSESVEGKVFRKNFDVVLEVLARNHFLLCVLLPS